MNQKKNGRKWESVTECWNNETAITNCGSLSVLYIEYLRKSATRSQTIHINVKSLCETGHFFFNAFPVLNKIPLKKLLLVTTIDPRSVAGSGRECMLSEVFLSAAFLFFCSVYSRDWKNQENAKEKSFKVRVIVSISVRILSYNKKRRMQVLGASSEYIASSLLPSLRRSEWLPKAKKTMLKRSSLQQLCRCHFSLENVGQIVNEATPGTTMQWFFAFLAHTSCVCERVKIKCSVSPKRSASPLLKIFSATKFE